MATSKLATGEKYEEDAPDEHDAYDSESDKDVVIYKEAACPQTVPLLGGSQLDRRHQFQANGQCGNSGWGHCGDEYDRPNRR